ncbi:MAG: toll/interleukin-1 receptor domain-containing protein [Solobacterium sp.]|nr:toll/interleukin-1 receptor domain-containing protein [Solobacterium sp.]
MINHYNAFISYRHEKRDIEVAKEVQSQLEHFRIPESLKESARIERIERVFRDKDELPLTSNLSDDIETALRQSDYLIVICSEHTAESQWVQREINLFLETHSQECVLTVLSHGEPEDVIPERLKYRIETEVDKDGNIQETRIPLEPLSCDYRMPFRAARKKELPRLAAVMIGCSYDELVQRAEQYRTQRRRMITAAAGTAGAAAISYLLWSNARINENLELALENLRQSQIHESQYLSSESLEALNDQDRILAVQLALAALPDGETDRPVIAEAEYALASAIGTYQIPEHQSDYFAVRKYSSEAIIRDFMISPDDSTLVLVDSDRRISLFSLIDSTKKCEIQLDTGTTVVDAKAQGIACVSGNTVTMLSWEDGSELYRTELPHWISASGCGTDACAFAGDRTLTILDAQGQVTHTAECPEEGRFGSVKLSADAGKILLEQRQEDTIRVWFYDTEQESPQKTGPSFAYIMDMAVTDSGDAVVLELVNGTDKTTYGVENAVFYYDMTARLACYRSGSASPRWSRDVSFIQDSNGDIVLTSYSDDSGDHDAVLCSSANIQTLVDLSDGRLVRRAEYPYPVRSILNGVDNTWLSLLQNGDIALFSLSSEFCTTFAAFPENTAKGARFFSDDSVGIMILPRTSRAVIRYEMDFANPNYSELPGIVPGYGAGTKVVGPFLLISDQELFADTATITVYDLESKQIAHEMVVESSRSIQHFGMTADLETVYAVTQDAVVHTLHLPDGKESTYRLAAGTDSLSAAFAVDDDHVYALINGLQDTVFSCYDIPNGTEELHSIAVPETSTFSTLDLRDDHRFCVSEATSGGKRILYLIDLSEYTAVPVYESENMLAFDVSCGDTFLAVRDEQCIRLMDYEGTQLGELPMDMNNVLSFHIFDDQLYVLSNSSLLEAYSRDGEKTAGYSVFVAENSAYNSMHTYEWHRMDNTLFFGDSTLWNVLDLSQNQSKLYITSVLAFDPERSQILVRRWSPDSAGAFHLCTTEELIAAGKEVTAGEEMSAETKQYYGLK